MTDDKNRNGWDEDDHHQWWEGLVFLIAVLWIVLVIVAGTKSDWPELTP